MSSGLEIQVSARDSGGQLFQPPFKCRGNTCGNVRSGRTVCWLLPWFTSTEHLLSARFIPAAVCAKSCSHPSTQMSKLHAQLHSSRHPVQQVSGPFCFTRLLQKVSRIGNEKVNLPWHKNSWNPCKPAAFKTFMGFLYLKEAGHGFQNFSHPNKHVFLELCGASS